MQIRCRLKFARFTDPSIVLLEKNTTSVSKLKNIALAVIDRPIKLHTVDFGNFDVDKGVIHQAQQESVRVWLERQQKTLVKLVCIGNVALIAIQIQICKLLRGYVL